MVRNLQPNIKAVRWTINNIYERYDPANRLAFRSSAAFGVCRMDSKINEVRLRKLTIVFTLFYIAILPETKLAISITSPQSTAARWWYCGSNSVFSARFFLARCSLPPFWSQSISTTSSRSSPIHSFIIQYKRSGLTLSSEITAVHTACRPKRLCSKHLEDSKTMTWERPCLTNNSTWGPLSRQQRWCRGCSGRCVQFEAGRSSGFVGILSLQPTIVRYKDRTSQVSGLEFMESWRFCRAMMLYTNCFDAEDMDFDSWMKLMLKE